MVDSHFIVLEPDKELEFARPFTSVVKQTLTVYNQHPSEAIAFKVKTTAPKQYCVRPNAGKIAPNSQCQVQILLQAMREDPPEDVKCKDKFLVQAISIPKDLVTLETEESATKLSEMWTQAEQLKKADPDAAATGAAATIIEKKLRCVYTGSSSLADKDHDHPTTTSAAAAAANNNNNINSTNSASSTAQSSSKAAASSGLADVELFEAKETIKKLNASIENYKNEINKLSGLRQRKGGAGSADGKDQLQAMATTAKLGGKNGFGIEVVALVAILGLLIGIFFF